VREYEDGKVSKEQLDSLSTCDMTATVNDGLSTASKADAHVFQTSEVIDHMERAVEKAEAERVSNEDKGE